MSAARFKLRGDSDDGDDLYESVGRGEEGKRFAYGSSKAWRCAAPKLNTLLLLILAALATLPMIEQSREDFRWRNGGGLLGFGAEELKFWERSGSESGARNEEKIRRELAKRLTDPDDIRARYATMDLESSMEAEDPFIQAQWDKNRLNLSVELFGKIIGSLPEETIYTRYYYPEEDHPKYSGPLIRYKAMRFVRLMKYRKDKLYVIVKHLAFDVVWKNIQSKYFELKHIATEQLLAYRDVGIDLLRTCGDWLSKRQEYIIQGAAVCGAVAAVTTAMMQTVLNDKWRLMQQFVPPTDDLELDQGTMVYAPIQVQPPVGNVFGNTMQQQQQATPPPPQDPKWVLCELQGQAVAGEYARVVAYSNRMSLQVPFENLRLARPEDQFILTAMQGEPQAIIQSLESTGASVNARDIQGNTALLLVCENGNKAAAAALLEAGANPNIPNLKGVTPLLLACTRGKLDLVELLLDYGARLNKALPDGKTPLYQAVAANQPEVVEMLLERGARPNQLTTKKFSPLFMACQSGNVNLVRLLLAHGAGWTMNVAADLGQGRATPIFMAAQKGYLPVIQALAEAGVDLDKGTLGKNKATPLMVAAQSGNGPVASYLIEMGADPDRRISDGSTALNLAIQFGHIAVAQILINGGANVDNEDKRGFTALHMAVQTKQGRIVQMLLDAGADPNIFSLQNRVSPLTLALHICAQAKGATTDFGIAKMLIEPSKKGLYIPDRDGHNAYFLAAMACKGNNETDLIFQLLKTGGDEAKAISRRTGGKRRPRNKEHIYRALEQVKRYDLIFLVDVFDKNNPDEAMELYKERARLVNYTAEVRQKYKIHPLQYYRPLMRGSTLLQLEKRPLVDEIEQIRDDMRANKTREAELEHPEQQPQLQMSEDRFSEAVERDWNELMEATQKYKPHTFFNKTRGELARPTRMSRIKYWLDMGQPEIVEHALRLIPRDRPILAYPTSGPPYKYRKKKSKKQPKDPSQMAGGRGPPPGGYPPPE